MIKKKKSPHSVSLATTSNLRFFSKCLVPVIVFLLDRDLRCSLKLLVPLMQSAYQRPKLYGPPLLLPLASSPAPRLIPSSQCRHQSEPPTLSAVITAVFWLLSAWMSVDIPQDLLHLPKYSNRRNCATLLLHSLHSIHFYSVSRCKDLLDCVILSKCMWLANEMSGSKE